jgi:hypothetical protein
MAFYFYYFHIQEYKNRTTLFLICKSKVVTLNVYDNTQNFVHPIWQNGKQYNVDIATSKQADAENFYWIVQIRAPNITMMPSLIRKLLAITKFTQFSFSLTML